MLLTKAELYKIREKTVFDEDNMRWIVPYFYLRQKEVILPKINARDTVLKEISERTVVVETASSEDDTPHVEYIGMHSTDDQL